MVKIPSGWLAWLTRRSNDAAQGSALAQHARRLEALWQVARMHQSDGATRQLAMLKAGASALRPGQVFYGQLTRLDGNDLVIVDGGATVERTDPFAPPSPRIAKGLRYPVDQGAQADVLAAGATIGWQDVRSVPTVSERSRTREFAARAVVGSAFTVSGKTHFLMFYSAQVAATPFTADDYAYVDVLASFLASHLHQGHESATQTRLAQNAGRLTALWEVARAPQLDDRARLLTMLEAGARALKPLHAFYGQLSYQDGADIVILAGSERSDDDRLRVPDVLLQEGTRFALEDGIQTDVLAASGTIGWADASTAGVSTRKRVHEFATRAIIGTKFLVGERLHFLLFFSYEAAAEQFTPDDYAYVEVLASFFASQLQRGVERRTEIRLVQNAYRSTALREIATTPRRLDDESRLLAMLNASARALRPGQSFQGQLSYQDGADAVVIIGTPVSDMPDRVVAESMINGAGRYQICDGVQAELLAAGVTIGWDDAYNVPALQARARVRAFGWRAVIGSTFQLGGRTHFLLFGSMQPAAEPFTQDDCAYVDVLAAFFASNLHQGKQRDRIREQLEIDTLTSLPNRATFRAAATSAMKSAVSYAMVVIDIDGWKRVTEIHGHQTADALLVEVAATFAALADPGELVARLTGETFAMLVHDGDVPALQERIRGFVAALGRPYSIGDRFGKEHVSLTVCAGLALQRPGATFESLFMNAEAALSAAKQIGPGSLALFNEAMHASDVQRQLVRTDLPKAVASGQLDVEYQPMVTLSTMSVCGANARVRWMHPEHGPIAAADFLPFAWENGVTVAIGRFVMQRVASDLPVLTGDRDFRAYINVSARDLSDPDFLSDLQLLLGGKQTLANGLGLEIAEAVMMRDAQWTIAILEELKRQGLAIAIDNFGTGASSITYLKKLPLDIIKIDGSLVSGLPHDRDSVVIVEALLAMAEKFGCATLAKNIENAEQLAWLKAHNCTMGQGLHIARPLSALAFSVWVANLQKGHAVA